MELSETKYLQYIDSPQDLKAVPHEKLPEVCQEVRQFIIDQCAQHPGHLGSSLGVVELTVALHYVFNTPYDRVVWDVGHQAYAHKILTGRRDKFHTNRQFGGLCGFPSPKESEYDSFGVGHSSTSISAGLGMSIASRLKHEQDRQVVVVIGDGAMTGGLAFEGLNNTSMDKNNMLIVLNDNQMAIDPIKGGFTQYLLDITTSTTYNRLRYRAAEMFRKRGLLSDNRKWQLQQFNNSIKTLLSHQSTNLFEGLNLRYYGPADGHDVDSLVRIFSEIKNHKGPKVLHLLTRKGKGYKPAEESVTVWHAPGEFDVETGERHTLTPDPKRPPLFQDVFGHTLLELAKQDEHVVGITPAMPSGCSMSIMQKEMPDRVFDVGIAEGHAVTFSAGLAKDGMIPFCNIYSSFMQRAYDNVIHDVALQQLPVIMCLDRAGLVGQDGATHHGLLDLAYMRPIPNLYIAAPMNEKELRNLMYTAYMQAKSSDAHPYVIRYPRGRGVCPDWEQPMEQLPIGKGRKLREGKNLAILTIGSIGIQVEKAIEQSGADVAHYDMRYLKPLDEELLHEVGKNFKHIITVEDGMINGGLGSAVLEFMADNNYQPTIKRLGIKDQFVEHGSTQELLHLVGLDAEGIAREIENYKLQ